MGKTLSDAPSKAWILSILGSAIGLMVAVSWVITMSWYNRLDREMQTRYGRMDRDMQLIRDQQSSMRRELREDNRKLESYLLQLMGQKKP